MAYYAAYIPAEAKSRLTLTSIFPPMIFIKFCTRVIVHMTIIATPARFSVALLAASIQQQYQVCRRPLHVFITVNTVKALCDQK